MRLLDIFKPDDTKKLNSDKSELIINRKQISRIVAGALLFGFFIFIVGYFLGKKRAAQEFMDKIEHDSFADHITYSMNSIYENNVVKAVEKERNQSNDQVTLNNEMASVQDESIEKVGEDLTNKIQYQAQLFGGTYKAVHQFVERLKERGISVQAKKRISKTAKGRTIRWYQAVTPTYVKKTELLAEINKIKRYENINGINVVEVN